MFVDHNYASSFYAKLRKNPNAALAGLTTAKSARAAGCVTAAFAAAMSGREGSKFGANSASATISTALVTIGKYALTGAHVYVESVTASLATREGPVSALSVRIHALPAMG